MGLYMITVSVGWILGCFGAIWFLSRAFAVGDDD